MPTQLPYILAVILGLVILFLPEIQPQPFVLGLFYFLAAGIFGFLWPKQSWRWGLWIAGPIILLLGLSVLFAGQFEIFLKKDLPILLSALIPACLGSFISSWFRVYRTRKA